MDNEATQTHCASCAMVPPAPGQKLCAQCQREHKVLDQEDAESEGRQAKAPTKQSPPTQYFFVEQFGHRCFGATVTEVKIAGVEMLRCELVAPEPGQPPLGSTTISGQSLFAITPCSEARARAANRRTYSLPDGCRPELPVGVTAVEAREYTEDCTPEVPDFDEHESHEDHEEGDWQ